MKKKYKGLRPIFKTRINFKPLVIVGFVFFLLIFTFSGMDNKILPSAIAISRLKAKTISNMAIDNAVKTSISDMNVKSSDFFINNNITEIKAFSVNTMLINNMCSDISKNITSELKKVEGDKIGVPFGTLTGVEAFSNVGPEILFSIRQMGESMVDYETEFLSVGINQTNFKIWINIDIAIQIVNPLKEEKINLTRKVMLVDTVINGDVPERYMNF